MGMSSGGAGGSVSEINVTPLIDVLLVLLIIFMVIVPVAPKGLDALLPQPPKRNAPSSEQPDTIVVSVLADGANGTSYKINETSFSRSEIEAELSSIYAVRQEKVMFVKGDSGVDFAKVAEVIDFGHQAGVDNIGLITPKVEAGQ